MSDILSLFDAVTVSNTERITERDREYCERQQKYYEFAIAMSVKTLDLAKEIAEGEKEYDAEDCNGYRYSYFDHYSNQVKLSVDKAKSDLQLIHAEYIGKVIRYFEQAYNISLEGSKAFEIIFPGRPSDLKNYSSQETIEKYESEMTEYEKAFLSPFNYERLVDFIFAQLNGLSFKDRAAEEIKTACRQIYQDRRYYTAELKGKTITFPHMLHIRDEYSWDKGGKIDSLSNSSDMYKVFNALSLFLHDNVQNIFSHFLSRLNDKTGSSLICDHYPGSEFIESVRIYKNGKVVVKFTESQKALVFAKEYCCYLEETAVAV
jgi:hypothetical protein